MAKRPPSPSIPDEEYEVVAVPLPLQQDVPADTDLRFQVLVRDPGGDAQPCAVRSPRGRRLTIRGESYEHVAEAPDGTWIYERRAW